MFEGMSWYPCGQLMSCNEFDFRTREAKRPMGLKVYHDGFEPANSTRVAEGCSLHEIEANVHWVIRLKERLEASYYYILY